jgi:hypothetical protein
MPGPLQSGFAQNVGMAADLQPITSALAALTDPELGALHHAIERSPPMAPGLLAYLEHACDHEIARRDRRVLSLHEPREAIPHEELGQSFATIAALMMHFKTHPRVRALIEAVGDELAARPPEVLH